MGDRPAADSVHHSAGRAARTGIPAAFPRTGHQQAPSAARRGRRRRVPHQDDQPDLGGSRLQNQGQHPRRQADEGRKHRVALDPVLPDLPSARPDHRIHRHRKLRRHGRLLGRLHLHPRLRPLREVVPVRRKGGEGRIRPRGRPQRRHPGKGRQDIPLRQPGRRGARRGRRGQLAHPVRRHGHARPGTGLEQARMLTHGPFRDQRHPVQGRLSAPGKEGRAEPRRFLPRHIGPAGHGPVQSAARATRRNLPRREGGDRPEQPELGGT